MNSGSANTCRVRVQNCRGSKTLRFFNVTTPTPRRLRKSDVKTNCLKRHLLTVKKHGRTGLVSLKDKFAKQVAWQYKRLRWSKENTHSHPSHFG